ncbi:S9 family peptidase [candidate division KSB1 bacterium]|nr:S9 family peptidase [candidate division KSB1 bacterium]
MLSCHRLFALCVVAALVVSAAVAAPLTVNPWLVTGTLSIPRPLFSDTLWSTNSQLDQLDPNFRDLLPEAGGSFPWSPLDQATWEKQSNDTLKFRIAAAQPYAVFAASYVTTTRRQELPLKVSCGNPVAVWFDGKLVGKQSTAKDNLYEVSGTVDAHTGKHLLLVKCIGVANISPASWTLTASFTEDSTRIGTVQFSAISRRGLQHWTDWGLFQELGTPAVSADGRYVAVVRSQRDEKYKKSSWIEVYDSRAAKLVETIRPGSGLSTGSIWFMPVSPALVYGLGGDNGTTLWKFDLVSRTTTPLLRDAKEIDHVVCSPDEQYLYFFQDDEDQDEGAYKLYDEVEDRVFDYNRLRHIVEYSIESRTSRTLNDVGTFAMNEFELSREGRKLAFTRLIPRPGYPFYNTELWVYDLRERDGQLITSLPLTESIRHLCWLPGGTQLYYCSAGDTANPADTVYHNGNQACLFSVDLKTKKISNVSANQTFSVAEGGARSRILWSERTGKLFFTGDDFGKVSLFRTTPAAVPKFESISLSRLVNDNPAIASDGSLLAYTATSPAKPFALFCFDPVSGKETELADPNRELISRSELATYEDYAFTNSEQQFIDGWIFYPPHFDANRKYPLVVYYYGGVSPRDRRFSFQYHWLAANGYVVYVLNPGGCVGYGQAFADIHCNDWGTRATADVIEGTNKILHDKSFLDPKRIAAYGGSYGGFITLDLATKTGMFTALCDMYGISNLANYWGSGTWGYWYGNLALPGAYPWNRRDVYVDKSPIFHADKVTSPLLILHGASDPNVPPAESDQMFVALKLLGKDVVLIKFKDETHNINVKFENLIEHRELMLEWFDKYAKGEPEGWNLRNKQ